MYQGEAMVADFGIALALVAQRTGAAYGIKGSFLFRGHHDDPRFTALLHAMKLA